MVVSNQQSPLEPPMPATASRQPIRAAVVVLAAWIWLPLLLWGRIWFDGLIWPLMQRGWPRAAWAVETLCLALTFELCFGAGQVFFLALGTPIVP